MSWKNIRLILRREIRDQLRDRRTLFMIAVLPLLFYPLLGVCVFQISQFLSQHTSQILVVGHNPTGTNTPKLFDDDHFSSSIFGNAEDADLVKLKFLDIHALQFMQDNKWPEDGELSKPLRNELKLELRNLMDRYECEAVVFFPPTFFRKLEAYPEQYSQHVAARGQTEEPLPEVPAPEILYDNSTDKKRQAGTRVQYALESWKKQVGEDVMRKAHVPPDDPFNTTLTQITQGGEERINASLWSKIYPFVLMIWAVTGAFYPAVDLCAGEKERGTLETLLSSPARRSEIVMGKLCTVMLFSVFTAVLNLISMCLTGAVVIAHLGQMAVNVQLGPPPLLDIIWMTIILLPVAALFSAVCLALAAFARSTKEGQYYLMPVILITMPLILLPMAPNIELNFGFSLIPVSGMVLLMRSMMEGTFHELWPYAFPVAAVTLACCWLSVRWAIEQFSREDVLFREGERWDLHIWMKHLMRDREDTPTAALAVLAGVLILVVRFFVVGAINVKGLSPAGFLTAQSILLIATVLAPILIMAFVCTRQPRETLLIKRPSWPALPLAAALALALLPIDIALQSLSMQLFTPNPEILEAAKALQLQFEAAPLWLSLIAIALVPPVCEELAFRGFLLSGFRHSGSKWRAIAASSFFFAVTHTILYQQVNAFFVGLLLGYLAVQTRSICAPLVYHCVHNGTVHLGTKYGWLDMIANNDLYAGMAIFFGTLAAVVLIFWFHEVQPRIRTRGPFFPDAVGQAREAAAITG